LIHYYSKKKSELAELKKDTWIISKTSMLTKYKNRLINNINLTSISALKDTIERDLGKATQTNKDNFLKVLTLERYIYIVNNNKKNYKKVNEVLDYDYVNKIPPPLIPCQYTKQNCLENPRDVKCCDKGKVKILRCGVGPETMDVKGKKVRKGCYDQQTIRGIRKTLKDNATKKATPTGDFTKYYSCPAYINEDEVYCNNVFDFSYDFDNNKSDFNQMFIYWKGVMKKSGDTLLIGKIRELEKELNILPPADRLTATRLAAMRKETDPSCSNTTGLDDVCKNTIDLGTKTASSKSGLKSRTRTASEQVAFCDAPWPNLPKSKLAPTGLTFCERACGECDEDDKTLYTEKLIYKIIIYEEMKKKKYGNSNVSIIRKGNEKITGSELSAAVYDNVKSMSMYGKILTDPNIGVGNDYLVSTHKCIDDEGKERYVQTPIHASGERVNRYKQLAKAINKSISIINNIKVSLTSTDVRSSGIINDLKNENRGAIVTYVIGGVEYKFKITEEIYYIVNTEPSSGLVYGLIDDLKETNPVSLLTRFMAQSENASIKCKDIAKKTGSYPFSQYVVKESGKDLNENVNITTVKESPVDVQGCYIIKEGFSRTDYILELIAIILILFIVFKYF
jgi:hypothetical protein